MDSKTLAKIGVIDAVLHTSGKTNQVNIRLKIQNKGLAKTYAQSFSRKLGIILVADAKNSLKDVRTRRILCSDICKTDIIQFDIS